MAKKLMVGTIVVFVFVFIFDWVFHGMLLKGMYQQTADLWRPESDMKKYMVWMLLSQLLFALFMCINFARAHECKGIAGGVQFGLAIGGILAAMNIGMYAYLPLPSLALPLIWTIAGFAQTIGIGVILALFCCRQKEA